MSLAEFLRDHLRRRVRIEKAVAQDLTNGLVGAPIIGFRPCFLRVEGGNTAAFKSLQDLVIALTAIAIFLGDGADVGLEALAFHEHEDPAGDFVAGLDGEGTGRASEFVSLGIEFKESFHRA